MDFLLILAKALVYVLMVASLIAAIAVVTLRNIFHAALALVGVLLATAGLFVAFRADFLAVIQVLLYVGAVMTLVIFAIMLTQRLNDKSLIQNNRQSLPAALALSFFLILVITSLQKATFPLSEVTVTSRVTAADLGTALLGPYVFPFEVISVILVAALIGAVILAQKEKNS